MMQDRKSTVLYDAGCEVCSAFRRAVQRRDRRGRLEFMGNNADNVRRVAPGLDPGVAAKTLVLAHPDGSLWKGARAVFGTVAQTGGICGFLCRVMSWKPLSLLAEPGYRLFARNRGRFARFFDGTDA